MFKLVYAKDFSRNVVHLLSPGSPLDSAAGDESLKKIRTRVAIRAAMRETNCASAYALEQFVATRRGFDFLNYDRSQTFDRLLKRGSPAIEDVGRWPMDGPTPGQSMEDYWKSPDAGRANGRIMEVMWALDNIGSMRESLRHDIWELLRAELPSTKRLNQLKRVYSFPELDESHPFTEHAQIVFVILKDGIEGRSQESALYFLTRAVLQLRLAERAGNLPQFIACLAGLCALRIPLVDEMNPILAELSTSLSAHVRSVFSHVRLQGRTAHGVAIARGRLSRDGIALTALPVPSGAFEANHAEFVAEPNWPELVA